MVVLHVPRDVTYQVQSIVTSTSYYFQQLCLPLPLALPLLLPPLPFRFDQIVPYNGGAARVYGGDMIAHVQDNQLVSISGNVAPGISAILPPTVGKAAARRNQLAHVRARAPAFAGAGLSATELLVRLNLTGCLTET
jgi:hypothetical protein